ncbi:MAG: DUF1800 family protein [Candidatus Kapabacteria bacterium]|nr:DUF1800 family protein [Candidatus Kapabacteria bacterium]
MIEQYIPSVSDPFDYSRAGHLLRRCVIGVRDAEIRNAVEQGLEQTLDTLLTPWSPDMQFIDEFAYNTEAQVVPPADGKDYAPWFWEKMRLLNTYFIWQLQNVVKSPLSIQERLWFCWHRHFCVRSGVFAEFSLDYNEVLRRNSMGNFKQFFTEITLDVEMQTFLSFYENLNPENGKERLNENYAREMMELFTCGITDADGKPNYTQRDIREAARSLTGWYYNINEANHHQRRKTLYTPERHDDGVKTYLGQTGKWNTFDVIDILFRERAEAIAYRICYKLCTWFVSDTPDTQIVRTLAGSFLKNNWELKPVIRELLGSRYFFDKQHIGVLKKSHIEYVIGMVRQFSLTNIPDFAKKQNRTGDLNPRLRSWGEYPHSPANVGGWTGGRDWVNSSVLSQRMKFAADVVLGRLENFSNPSVEKMTYWFNPVAFAKELPEHTDLTGLADALTRALLPVSPNDIDARKIHDALAAGASLYEWDIDNPKHQPVERIRACLEQIVSHPAYQLY